MMYISVMMMMMCVIYVSVMMMMCDICFWDDDDVRDVRFWDDV